MLNRKKKIGSSSGIIESENRLLRLLRSDMGFQVSLIGMGRKDQGDTYSEAQKEIRNAMLEAEHKKAEAIMMMRQRQNFY